MAVHAAGLELVAERRLVHEDVHADGEEDCHEDTGVDLRVREELVEAELRRATSL